MRSHPTWKNYATLLAVCLIVISATADDEPFDPILAEALESPVWVERRTVTPPKQKADAVFAEPAVQEKSEATSFAASDASEKPNLDMPVAPASPALPSPSEIKPPPMPDATSLNLPAPPQASSAQSADKEAMLIKSGKIIKLIEADGSTKVYREVEDGSGNPKKKKKKNNERWRNKTI